MQKAKPAIPPMSTGCNALLRRSCGFEGAHGLLRKDSGWRVNARRDLLNDHGPEKRSSGSKIT